MRSSSYIDPLDWIKKKKGTVNPENTEDKCFQSTATVASTMKKLNCIQKEFQILNRL